MKIASTKKNKKIFALGIAIASIVLVGSCEKKCNLQPKEGYIIVGEGEDCKYQEDTVSPIELTDPITESITLKDRGLDVDYVCNIRGLNIPNGVVLTIEPGVCIQFGWQCWLNIDRDAQIIAKGTADKPIKFIGTSNEKGAWAGIQILSNENNVLDYVEFINAGGFNQGSGTDPLVGTDPALNVSGKVSITNSLIDRSEGYGIRLTNYLSELVVFSNNTISYCNGAPICARGAYCLRNIANNNHFLSNGGSYIRIDSQYHYGDNFTIHHLDGYPWYFANGFVLDDNRNVTIEAGAVIWVEQEQQIVVPENSHLIAEGTANSRITIKGWSDVIMGYWGGIEVYSKTPGTKFIYCDIFGGGSTGAGYNLYCYAPSGGTSYVALDNTVMRSSSHYGLYLDADGSTSIGCNIVQSSQPASVTFSNCIAGNIWSNCTGNGAVYASISDICDLQ